MLKDAFYSTNVFFVEGRNKPPESKPHHIIVRNCTVSNMHGAGIVAIEADLAGKRPMGQHDRGSYEQ